MDLSMLAVADSLGAGIAAVSSNFEILSINSTMREWYPAIDPKAKPLCYRTYNDPPRDGPCSYCPVVKTLQDGQAHEAVTETPRGHMTVNYRIVATPIIDGAGRITGAIELVEDVTDRMREQKRLQDVLHYQDRLNELLRLSLEPVSLEAKLNRMLDCLVHTTWFDVERKGCVMVRDGAGLRMAAQVGLGAPARKRCARLRLGECLCGKVAQSGEELLALGTDERHDAHYDGMPPHGNLTLPLKGAGETLGALSLYLKAGAAPGPGQMEFARTAAGIFSGVVLLARSEERALHSQKMDAIGRLAGGIAHDFNNILTAIRGYSSFLVNALEPADPRRQDAEEIARASDRAAGLTRHLLTFSRRQVLAPCSVNLNDAVGSMSKMLKCLLGDTIQLELKLEPELAWTFIDPGQFEQVLLNLCVNARDAMPDGGSVTLSTAMLRRPAAGGGEADWLQLAVADTGTGMEPDVLRHIFEPFFTTKPKEKGTGLGLSTAYGIVTQSGGEIEVWSEPGQGSIFRVLLPAAERREDAEAPPEGVVPEGRETVLVVEDEEAVRTIVERSLSSRGYRVLAASGGEEGLALLEREERPVALLVTDVAMPRMTGPQLAEKVLGRRPGMKVLFISGNNEGAFSEKGLLKPGAVLIQKPFTPEAIARKVREVLERSDTPSDSATRS
ncbi:MAG: response regulator [Elusimicrobia bacterium]|nr:response regulator [Elusimicrobiota bacterium]